MTFRGGLIKCALHALNNLSSGMWNEAVIFRVDRGKYYTVTDDKGASDFAARVKRETARIVFFGTLQELRSLLQQPIPNLFEEPNDAS